jgi:hypothetical protein
MRGIEEALRHSRVSEEYAMNLSPQLSKVLFSVSTCSLQGNTAKRFDMPFW